jgi:hypothetical protein
MKSVVTPWGPLGYITFKRTYSRKLKENDPNSPTEEFPDSVERVIRACKTQLKVGFTLEEEEELSEILLKLKGSVAGRFWWQLGTKTVDRLGLLSLQNCAFTIVNDPIRPFTWTMDALMLGSGVGYNIQREYVNTLPKVKGKLKIERVDESDADFIVPDSREGWVKLLAKVLKAHFYSGVGFTYSTICIRSKGAPIKSFGGVASGPEELCWGMHEIHKILNSRAKKKLRPIDCLDIMNIIGAVVVAGNVRRSAQIAIGDPDDVEFLKAKRWDLGAVPNWRAMSNNSVAADDLSELAPEFWQTYQQGEPYGLINIRLARLIGRIGETQYPDPKVAGFNPCAEQSLADKETCCLADIFLPNIESKEELIKVATYLYRICKHSLTLPCHLKETEEIVHELMRMGIGITGARQATFQQLNWLSECYEHLRDYDRKYSAEHGFPNSVKLTTVKPSGTLSLLPGVTPGAHASPAGPYYIRRIRMASSSPLVQVCKNHGYYVEFVRKFDGSEDRGTVVVEFPCKVPDHTPIGGDQTAVEQLAFVKFMQEAWSDNSVSVTVYYKKEEIPAIQEWLVKYYRDNVKTVSFLLYHGHGFDQAPYETISKERYEEMIKNVIPIEHVDKIRDSEVDDNAECENGSCPIK